MLNYLFILNYTFSIIVSPYMPFLNPEDLSFCPSFVVLLEVSYLYPLHSLPLPLKLKWYPGLMHWDVYLQSWTTMFLHPWRTFILFSGAKPARQGCVRECSQGSGGQCSIKKDNTKSSRWNL